MVFAIVLFIVTGTGIATYKSLSKIANEIYASAQPDLTLIKIKEIAADIAVAEKSVRSFMITEDENDVRSYLELLNDVYRKSDTLRFMTRNNEYLQVQLDSVSHFINEKIKIDNEYLGIHYNETVKNTVENITNYLNQKENELKTVNDKTSVGQGKKTGFWKRLFGAKKENPDNSSETSTPATGDNEKIISEIRKNLMQVKEQETKKLNRQTQMELILLQKDAVLQSKTVAVIKALEKNEWDQLLERTASVRLNAQKLELLIAGIILAADLVVVSLVVLVFKSISKSIRYRKELEQSKIKAEDLARKREDFLANMSHEIRTPLSGIIGFTEQLAKTNLDEIQKSYIKTIESSSEHLLSIVNEILDFAKLESGKLTIEQVGFEFGKVVKEVYNSLKVSSDKNAIEFNYRLNDLSDLIVIGDPLRLRQILINMAGNAIKFTKSGSVQIACSIVEEMGSSLRAKIDFIDTGPGIPPDQIENIFVEFTQVDEKIVRKYGGTGLGLAICKKLVELQKGTITVNSVLGKGSVFSVILPYLKGTPEDIKEKAKMIRDHNPDLLNKHILLVDDDETNRMVGKVILKNFGFKTDVASSGHEAIDKIQNNDYDVALMDIQMPDLDGIETTQYIREELKYPKSKIPIIAVTANIVKEDIEKYFKAGMNGYLLKPYKESELWNKINEVLSQ